MKLAVISLCAILTSAQTQVSNPPSTVAPPAHPQPQSSSVPKPNTLLDGTPVKLKLGRTISSADAKVGEEVDFETIEDVSVDGVVVIPKGSLAMATVTEAEHKKSMGRAGKLNVNIDSVRLADQEKATLRATEGGKGGGHVGAMTGAIVATSIVFFPAAPLFLFVHGKDITIPKGTEITAYTDGDMTLDMARFSPTGGNTVVAQAGQSQLKVDANQPNCDIEVDGSFVGNTPSALSLTPGKHEISVKKKGYVAWTRSVSVSGASININADLQPETASQPASGPSR